MYNFTQSGPFDEQQIEALRQRLAGMDQAALIRFYNSSLHLCMLNRDQPPRAPFVQQLVQAWKEMTKRTQQSNDVFQLQGEPMPPSVKPKAMVRVEKGLHPAAQQNGILGADSNPATISA